MRVTYPGILVMIVAWSIAGYPLTAGVTSMLGIDNRPISIFMRAAVLSMTLLVLVRYIPKSVLHPSRAGALFFVFWVMYLMRMAADTMFGSGALGRNALDYWSFGVGTCFLPALAVLLARDLPPPQQLVRWTLWLSIAAVVLAAAFGSDFVTGSSGVTYDSGRLRLVTLNPIAFGHVGTTVFLIAYWKLRSERLRFLLTLPYLATATLGLAALGLSGSRGPLVALLASVLFIESSKGGRAIVWKAAILLLPLMALSVNLSDLDKTFNIDLFSRVKGAVQLTDVSASMRIEQVSSALNLFLEHPVFGATLEDPAFKIYPHNILVEALMATGLIGAALLFGFLVTTLMRGFGLAKRKNEYAVFAALFVQYAVAAQFSGSLYTWNSMWVIAALVASVSNNSASDVRMFRLNRHQCTHTLSTTIQ